jgi:hypothetical protein
MAVTDAQKVDLLLKKVDAGVSKTDTSANKSPSNETIASQVPTYSQDVWIEDADIPGTPPGSTTALVKVRTDAGDGAVQTTEDATSTADRSWETGVTNWIPPGKYGSLYGVKVYDGDPGAGGTQIFVDGSGSDDGFHFDYEAGVLNFWDSNVPGLITSSNDLWIEGYEYLGETLFGNTGFDLTASSGVDITSGNITAVPGEIDHGSLAGLGDDDHTQYLLADGTRALAGAWNMASERLTNVNIDTGDINTAVTQTNWDAAFTHISNDGSDHSFINQSVISGASPTFDGANFSGIDHGGLDGLGDDDHTQYLLYARGGEAEGDLLVYDGADWINLPKGTPGQILKSTTGIGLDLEWTSYGVGNLSDTNITGTPADNEVLAWDTVSSRWTNQTAAEAGLATIDGLWEVSGGNTQLITPDDILIATDNKILFRSTSQSIYSSGANILNLDAGTTMNLQIATVNKLLITATNATFGTDEVDIPHKLRHAGDTNTYINFDDDIISIFAGNKLMIKFAESINDVVEVNPINEEISFIVNGGVLDNLIQTDPTTDTLFLAGRTFTGYGVHSVKAAAAIGGTLSSQVLSVGNIGAGEDTIASYKLAANQLATPADYIKIQAWGTTANNANSKQVRLYLENSLIMDSTAQTATTDKDWWIEATIMMRTEESQKVVAEIRSLAKWLVTPQVTAPSEDTTSSLTVFITAEAVANDDVVCQGFLIEWGGDNAM